mmetsp:Transcript_138073/g.385181  ORF Transcript_138073/g.385181 Transcript_138073/m.385181 type:complete len:306 (+) Transcript_138073:1234-2151(+)
MFGSLRKRSSRSASRAASSSLEIMPRHWRIAFETVSARSKLRHRSMPDLMAAASCASTARERPSWAACLSRSWAAVRLPSKASALWVLALKARAARMAFVNFSRTGRVVTAVRRAVSISSANSSSAFFCSCCCLATKIRFKSAVTSFSTASAFWISLLPTKRIFFASSMTLRKALVTLPSPSMFSTSLEAVACSAAFLAAMAFSILRRRRLSLSCANSSSSSRSLRPLSTFAISASSTPTDLALASASLVRSMSCTARASTMALAASSRRDWASSSASSSPGACISAAETPAALARCIASRRRAR